MYGTQPYSDSSSVRLFMLASCPRERTPRGRAAGSRPGCATCPASLFGRQSLASGSNHVSAAAVKSTFGSVCSNGSRIRKGSAQQQLQTVLAVARCCRHCGERLSGVESALHSCTLALNWPFGSELVGDLPASSAGVRVARIRAGSWTNPSIVEQIAALWDFIRHDLSHGLELPSVDRAVSGAAVVFLGLRGREVFALLVAESLPVGAALEVVGAPQDRDRLAQISEGQEASLAEQLPATNLSRRATLGVNLIWVRRTERRKGLATALVDAARRHAGGNFGAASVPKTEVAFSQPTEAGATFAARYSQHQSNAKSHVLVYRL